MKNSGIITIILKIFTAKLKPTLTSSSKDHSRIIDLILKNVVAPRQNSTSIIFKVKNSNLV